MGHHSELPENWEILSIIVAVGKYSLHESGMNFERLYFMAQETLCKEYLQATFLFSPFEK